ncbi:helix-turn-helix domain-containing protein [Ichthyenterobacterium magnum]|uniref:Helix-turn-helix protein n=1 Tax=Ichthyenterobacterium magnum TaxID=1230530 RepID=A0A420DM80_9FLAO|nr:helix-turn-helix transcriptional regulator [Ichthyenterobacterium magnum]RKE95287.1 helix-turn-helix protein [Ichthyenterobacterium magnum]
MINTQNFAKRLQKVIDFYGETASSFSEKIGVQRSSISHILSGRNKPSLDFVMKVLASFPEVELYWLLNGKGHFPTQEKKEIEKTITKPKFAQEIEIKPSAALSNNKSIERIVIFYKDGSFKSFEE